MSEIVAKLCSGPAQFLEVRKQQKLGVRQMPSAHHRSLMHEGDGDGQYRVPLEKRSWPVETAEERRHQLRV